MKIQTTILRFLIKIINFKSINLLMNYPCKLKHLKINLFQKINMNYNQKEAIFLLISPMKILEYHLLIKSKILILKYKTS